jgi:hypothetical protein
VEQLRLFILDNAELVSAFTVLFLFLISTRRAIAGVLTAVGKDQDGRTLSDRMARVEYQLWENDGDSLKDRVNELDIRTRSMDVKLDLIQEIVVANTGGLPQPAPKVKKIRAVRNK